jgi:CheY-like chemotaxis protein
MAAAQAPSRVLVVDDEHVVADTLALILRGKGFDARAAYSGEEAAELAVAWNPDAMIVDILMGNLNGVALAMQLAQTLPSCRVLLMSGNQAAEELLKESKSLGHNFPILAKPFQPEQMIDFLQGQGGIGNA